jgi:hypothetical protein
MATGQAATEGDSGTGDVRSDDLILALVAVSVVSATGGWVFRDARARGLPMRKAVTWAVLASQEWPLLLLLYRRIRPKTTRAERSRADAAVR